jgi:hypothetical protein
MEWKLLGTLGKIRSGHHVRSELGPASGPARTPATRTERVRDHLRRPDAGGREPLTERPFTPFAGHSPRGEVM